MAGYPDWMNPNPQTAHMDMLLNNPAAGILPERMQTRERVEPPWQVPWQGNADFVTDIPGRQQSNLEEVPQTQRPAKPTNRWPTSGTSIADSFMGNLKRGFGRFMDQLVPPAY